MKNKKNFELILNPFSKQHIKITHNTLKTCPCNLYRSFSKSLVNNGRTKAGNYLLIQEQLPPTN